VTTPDDNSSSRPFAPLRPATTTGAHASLLQRGRGNLVTLGSAAVLAIYSAGYLKTRAAAERFAAADAERFRPPSAEVRDTAQAMSGLLASLGDSAALPDASSRAEPGRDEAIRTDVSVSEAGNASAPADAAPKPAAPRAAASAATESLVADHAAVELRAPSPAVTSPAVAVATPNGAPTPAPAPAPVDTTTPGAAADSATASGSTRGPYKDGTFSGWGNSRHGQIQVTVEVKDGHITNAWISACLTRWSCSWVSHLPAQVIARQSAEVDYVSGATQSGNAFYWGAVDALARAR
jgi:uncharacterized protein with FMN-binding domain